MIGKWNISNNLSVKTLFFISMAIVAAIVITAGFTMYHLTRYVEITADQNAIRGMEGLAAKLEDLKERALQNGLFLANNPQVVQAVQNQDSGQLQRVLAPMVKDNDMDFITITNGDGVVLLRTHEPKKKGDSVSKQYNVQRALQNQPLGVIEEGTVVKLSARAGFPVKNTQGKVIGVISTGYTLDKPELADKIKQQFGTDVTVFHGDTRINTTILKDGKRVVGTQLDPKIAKQVLENKMRFSGHTQILGVPYITSYMPLLGPNNQAIGVLFAGQSLSEVDKLRNQILRLVIVLSLVIIGITIWLIAYYLKKRIIQPVNQLVDCANQLALGNTDIKIVGASQDEIGILLSSFKTMADNIKEYAVAIECIAEGDLSGQIKVKSAQDILGLSMNKMQHNLAGLVSETRMLTEAAVDGRLSARGNVANFEGVYREIVQGFNATLDRVIEPLNEAIRVLDKLAENDYTIQMNGQYQGMLQEFAASINGVRMRLLQVQETFVRLAKGDTGQLAELRMQGQLSQNDQLIPAIMQMMASLESLITEVKSLSEAAVNGDLSCRSDITRFEGGFRLIVEGVNNTLDAVVRPINEAFEVLRQLADGNLTVNMAGNYRGDHALLKEAINTTIESFHGVLAEINQATEQVAAGSKIVSESSQVSAQGSAMQASTVEELTASVSEIAAMTRKNAVNAGNADQLALVAKEKAENGNQQMREMLIAMGEINQSSTDISKIIKVIDEIAFQTNILALNAAVEAARAGQYGKGFAVVAEEVRNLAARSAKAAKETTVLIEGSINKVESGSKLANETANALNQIVEGVNKTSALVGDIARSSNEQATGITQINQGLAQVSQVIQSSIANSEQSAATSEELSGQAEALRTMVERFKIEKGRETGPDLTPKAPAPSPAVSERRKRLGFQEDTDFGKY